MRVRLAGAAMRGPARVADAAGALERAAAVDLLGQRGQASLGLDDLDPAVALAHGQSCGVIPAVFQALEAIHQNRRRLLASHISNNSAHARFYSFSFISSKRFSP